MNKYSKFRNDNPTFIYRSYHFSLENDFLNVSFDFEIPGLAQFHPEWRFPVPDSCSVPLSDNLTLERLVFSLGMAEAVSYWKAVCSPEMRVECGHLDHEQIQWWKKLYFMGLGEFFYVNDINANFDSFINISSVGSFISSDNCAAQTPDGCLVPIGGGKDSALTLETLCRADVNCKCYAINKRNSISATVAAAGLGEDSLITAKRMFDRSLINLNNQGYLNGHTPFSAIVAFSAEITAYLHGLKYIVLSNEASANESTVAGQEVNHQYSKSFSFEQDFRLYEEKYLGTGVYYFSFLRPLAEFQIAKMFVKHEKYLTVFRSCNLGSKVSPDIWCADCPKCLFVCVILSPFVSPQTLTDIFGKNLLNEQNMLCYFKELAGLTEHKPFECVGSIDEVILSASLAVRNYRRLGLELPLLLREFVKLGLCMTDTLDDTLREYCSFYNEQNLLPPQFEAILKNEMERLL